jgi:hypothetical protein
MTREPGEVTTGLEGSGRGQVGGRTEGHQGEGVHGMGRWVYTSQIKPLWCQAWGDH